MAEGFLTGQLGSQKQLHPAISEQPTEPHLPDCEEAQTAATVSSPKR
jgi:hypothetical protein